MSVYEDGHYEITTKDFGNIQFIKADKKFINDEENKKTDKDDKSVSP